MNGNASRLIRLSACLLGLLTLGWVLTVHAAKPPRHGIPLPTDWSHRHLIYSQPRNSEEAARLQQDPRFEQQWHRRNDRLMFNMSNSEAAEAMAVPRKWRSNDRKMQRDWATSLTAGGTVGPGVFPAKFSFDTEHASCTDDFVVFTTSKLSNPLTQAGVVAFNNLYSGCGGTVPSVLWAYDTSGRPVTSPFFSRDGSQVGFVQTFNPGFAELVLVKWAPAPLSSVSTPTPITFKAEAQYFGCTAPCYTTVNLRDPSSAVNDLTSSVFYDYTNDIAWVGGDGGWVHKITNVFNGGTPAEVHDGSFPANVGSVATTSPVFDRISGNVFVADAGGFLHRINSTTGAVTHSGRLDFAAGVVDSPIVDVGAQKIYVFASNDGTADCGGAGCAAVYLFDTNFASSSVGTKVTVGPSSATPNPMYTGSFDNAYYTSPNATGNLYVCGNNGTVPALYQIPIQGGALPLSGLGTSLVTLGSTGTPGCSPVTDVFNPNETPGPNERVFVGVQDHGLAVGCTGGGGCLQSFPVTAWQATTVDIPSVYIAGQQILDSNLNIQVVTVGGTAGTTTPVWNPVVGLTTTDAGVTWLNQGPLLPAPDLWAPTNGYIVPQRVIGDGKLQAVLVPGISDATEPVWPPNAGDTILDGTVLWINVGPSTLAALPASGGTSGIIIDNVVGSSDLAGASQIYFSTLSDQVTCGSSSNTGCAIQASQSALQ